MPTAVNTSCHVTKRPMISVTGRKALMTAYWKLTNPRIVDEIDTGNLSNALLSTEPSRATASI